MQFQSKLQQAKLIKRYKRFLVDIETSQGEITIHCANTGRMTGCADFGFTAYYSTSSNAKRKYPHSLELTQNLAGDLICVNTSMANHVVAEAIAKQQIPELLNYDTLKQEVKYGDENSRIDILLSDAEKPACYIEVKSVTLLEENGKGYFPDAVTARGSKHLRELVTMKQQGHRAVLFFLIQHTGIKSVAPADHIDANYAIEIKKALAAGVEILCYRTNISSEQIVIDKTIPFVALQ